MPRFTVTLVACTAAALVACSGGGGGSAGAPAAPGAAPASATPLPAPSGSPGTTPSPSPKPAASATPAPTATPSPASAGSPAPTATPAGKAPALDARFVIPAGFTGSTIAQINSPRQLVALPNGDLLVGTEYNTLVLVPGAESAGAAGKPHNFITLSESPATGITLAPNGFIYAGTNTTIWKIPYSAGAQTASGAVAIARVRQGPVAPNSDGDVHSTTSVAATSTTLYAAVGSSCNACVETDPTRATVQRMNLDGSGMTTLATRARNPMATAINPATGSLWIGGAGQDALPYTHPYEYFDSPTTHGNAGADYGWPQCEENHQPYNGLHAANAPDCSKTVQPAIEFPAYSTLIGATFYPAAQTGPYAFPSVYRGGVFVSSHGSWHCCPASVPGVSFVAMNGDVPVAAVNWNDPTAQLRAFLSGLGSSSSSGSYIARPTGLAVGPQGSLFIADDRNGAIYRIRPSGT